MPGCAHSSQMCAAFRHALPPPAFNRAAHSIVQRVQPCSAFNHAPRSIALRVRTWGTPGPESRSDSEAGARMSQDLNAECVAGSAGPARIQAQASRSAHAFERVLRHCGDSGNHLFRGNNRTLTNSKGCLQRTDQRYDHSGSARDHCRECAPAREHARRAPHLHCDRMHVCIMNFFLFFSLSPRAVHSQGTRPDLAVWARDTGSSA